MIDRDDDDAVRGTSAVDPPSPGTAGARAMMHRLSRDLFGVEMGVVTLGRFEVIAEIGAGGMGVVYRARDPKLGREVALKLLRRGMSEQQRARLDLEARALARLNHPNVVQIYELFDDDEGLFLVMEYVEGSSLGRWQRGRGWRELVSIYEQAGRGLQAAHAAELIHRDFKPANVVVGDDGRARVADFGLARMFGLPFDSMRSGEEASLERSPSASPTRTGAVVGTPGYMSPEQAERGDLGASSDQFSFCVAMCEGVLGQRPPADASAEELLAGLRRRSAGSGPVAPSGAMPPAVLRRFALAMARGLRSAAEERWPDMGALLEAIEQLDPPSRWRGPGALLAIGGLGLFFGWSLNTTEVDPACASLEEVTPRWRDEEAAEIEGAAAQLGLEEHEVLARTINRAMREYAERWEVARAETCGSAEESSVSGEAGRCLARASEDFVRVGQVLRDRPQMLLGAQEALALLVPPAVCRSSPTLVLTREELDARVWLELTRAGVLAAARRNEEALAIYDALESAEGSSGLRGARLALGRGRLFLDSGDAPNALPHLELAVERALESDARSVLASSLAALASAHADVEDYGAAATTARWCRASASRSLSDIERAECLVASAAAHGAEPAVALRELEDGLRLRREAYGPGHPSESSLVRLIANVYGDLGQRDEARRRYTEERDRLEQRYGAQYPEVSWLEFNLAVMDFEDGELAKATERLEGVVESFEAVYGPSLRLAGALRLLAWVEALQEQLERAMEHCERAIALEASLPPEHPESGAALSLAGMIARFQADLPEAWRRYEQLAALRGTEVRGEQSLVWHNVAYFRCVLNACRGASDALDLADREAVEVGGAEVRHNATSVEAMIALSQGDAFRARSLAEQALRGAERGEATSPAVLEAEARWSLARAARLDGDEQRAHEQASRAVEAAADEAAALAAFEQLDPGLFGRVRGEAGQP